MGNGFFIWDHILAPGAMPVADITVTVAAIARETHRIRVGLMASAPLEKRRGLFLVRSVSRAALPLRCLCQSEIAAWIASPARTEQWIFAGGRCSSLTIVTFLIAIASSTCLPLTSLLKNRGGT